MNNLERNAIKIAELIGLPTTPSNTYVFEQYNGLMPIVFECNNNTNMEIHIYPPTVQLLGYKKYVFGYKNNLDKTEPEFIEAIQECVIKYLELKNG